MTKEEKRDAYLKAYRKANAEKIKKRKTEHYAANAEKIKKRKAEYLKANAEKIKKRKAEHYAANAEKIKKRKAEYRKANAEKIKKREAEYRARLHKSYLIKGLKQKGFTREQLTEYPEIIEVQKLILKTNRLCKTSKTSEQV